MPDGFTIKDSGARQEFAGGMVRDTTEGKPDYTGLLFGPMLERWAVHLTKGRQKYPDPEPGVPNWTLAQGQEELLRARQSAFRHFIQWLNGDRDEDHAAAVMFNLNLAEYVVDKMSDEPPRPLAPEGFEFTGEYRVPAGDGSEPFLGCDGRYVFWFSPDMSVGDGCRWILRSCGE